MAKAAGKSTRRHKYGKGGQKFYGTLEQNKLKNHIFYMFLETAAQYRNT